MKTKLISVPEAAERIGCSRSHIYNLIAAKQLTPYDISLKGRSKTRLSEADVDRYIEQAQVAGRQSA